MADDQRIILDSRWADNRDGLIGAVAARTSMHNPDKGEWKAYIGIAHGWNLEDDAQYIAAWGSSLTPEEAHGFFPQLDISKYKQE